MELLTGDASAGELFSRVGATGLARSHNLRLGGVVSWSKQSEQCRRCRSSTGWEKRAREREREGEREIEREREREVEERARWRGQERKVTSSEERRAMDECERYKATGLVAAAPHRA